MVMEGECRHALSLRRVEIGGRTEFLVIAEQGRRDAYLGYWLSDPVLTLLRLPPRCPHMSQHVFRGRKHIHNLALFKSPSGQRFRKGVGGRGLATNKPPKRAKKGSPEMCPPSPKGA